jgi:hypothetical protein
VIDACVAALEPLIGTGPACRAAGKSKATYYRRQQPPAPPAPRPPRSAPANALSASEVEAVLAALRSARFADLAPAQVWATLLDEDCYLCSISTMYRCLRATGEVRERRAQAAHPTRARPELMAEDRTSAGHGTYETAGPRQGRVVRPLRHSCRHTLRSLPLDEQLCASYAPMLIATP